MLGFFSSFYVKHKKTIVIRLLDLFLNWKKVQVVQSGPTLCDHMDYIVHGILQARILKWVVVPFSRGSSQPRDWTEVSHIADRFYQLSHQGSSRILEWVAYPFSRELSQPRNQTRVSCIAGGFFTNWVIVRVSKKQESSRKTSISALLTMPKPLTVWITINCGKFWKR